MQTEFYGTTVVVIVLLVFVLAVIIANIKIVPQAHSFVVERLGAFHASWGTGLHVKIPFLDRVAKKVSLKEQVVDFPPQPVITKDNVTMQIDTVVYFQITDPKLYAYGVENPISAIENLTATTLRNIIGEMELDHTLTSRDVINSKIRVILDEATAGLDPVVRDEVVDILLDFARDEEHSILISSHIVSDLEKLCDTIAFLHKGRLLLCEEKDALREEYALWHGTAAQLAALDARVYGKRVTPYGAEALVRRDAMPAGAELAPVSIEELFVLMVKGEDVQ